MFETRAPSAKLLHVGDKVSGRIVGVRRTQHCEYKSNIPLFWEKTGQGATIVKHAVNPMTGLPNDPKLQYELTLDTGVPDENGNTKRRLFVRGKRMESALRTAVQATAGEDGLLIGGDLTCTLTGFEASGGGGSDAKLYQFTYRPPTAGEGRKPDLTPHLAGGTWQQPDPQPAPAFALRQQQQVEAPRPVVTPYVTTSTAASPVHYDDQPPF